MIQKQISEFLMINRFHLKLIKNKMSLSSSKKIFFCDTQPQIKQEEMLLMCYMRITTHRTSPSTGLVNTVQSPMVHQQMHRPGGFKIQVNPWWIKMANFDMTYKHVISNLSSIALTTQRKMKYSIRQKTAIEYGLNLLVCIFVLLQWSS